MASNDTMNPAPSAPPRSLVDEEPPNYDSVMAAGGGRRGTLTRMATGFTESLQMAGTSVGRWFGVHDHDLLEWNRTGTLPPNELVHSYNVVPQQYPEADQLELGNRQEPGGGQEGGRERGRRERGRETLRRVTDTLNMRRRPKKPTREEVAKTLPTFWPVFTILVAIIEVVLLIAVMATEGVAPIAFKPKTDHTLVTAFGGLQYNRTASRQVVPNFFIGPPPSGLIHTGAKYTPCMRENIEFQIDAAINLYSEVNLRCCSAGPDNAKQCGVLPLKTCTGTYDGTVLGGASQCQLQDVPPENRTQSCAAGITLRPCCVGLLGDCVITTRENCTFQKGYWHGDKVLCSEVGTDCFKDICEFTWIGRTIGEIPSQGLRFVSSMFLYEGVVHLLIVGLFKLSTSWKIENRIGWLRVLCIYILSGVGGMVFSAIFDPVHVSAGGSAPMFGLLGVELVELLQGWKWVKKPFVALIKILVYVCILFVLGLLPFIDNFAHIGGFIFGVLSSFIFVPYISLGKWDRAKKLCLISIAVPIILVLYLVAFVIFYNNPNPEFCPECNYINCIPFTETFCDDFINSILPAELAPPS